MVRIGIDVGGTNVKAGIVDEQYNVLAMARKRTGAGRDTSEVLDTIVDTAKEALREAGLSMKDVCAVGAGFPGTCNEDTGLVEYANNLGFTNVPVCEELQKRLAVPVFMENDANVAVYGEYLAGALKGSKNCVFITLGTGVGGGILLEGKIFSGINYAGAELGHMVINMNGMECNCGRRGCWEMYASVTALKKQTRKAMRAHPESRMWELCPVIKYVSGKTSFDAMRLGDAVAKEVVENYIRYIGVGVINVINIFQPEHICIGGAIAKEGDFLLDPLKKMVKEERYSRYAHKQSILCATQLNNTAGIIGAAYLDTLH
ncbi:MAG: ROK family protein [Clostridia bacterium]|nr:ROK family protein [Clostridia bacterium]